MAVLLQNFLAASVEWNFFELGLIYLVAGCEKDHRLVLRGTRSTFGGCLKDYLKCLVHSCRSYFQMMLYGSSMVLVLPLHVSMTRS